MFKTREGKIIDEDKLMSVFVGDIGKGEKYYLDILGGGVLRKGEIKNFYEKRYKLIEPFGVEEIEKVMKDFIKDFSYFFTGKEDKKIVEELLFIKKQGGEDFLEKSLNVLKNDEGWMLGWREWRNTDFWEDVKDFILSADDKIKEVWDLDCSCAMCHLMGKDLEKDERVEVNWDFSQVDAKKEESDEDNSNI